MGFDLGFFQERFTWGTGISSSQVLLTVSLTHTPFPAQQLFSVLHFHGNVCHSRIEIFMYISYFSIVSEDPWSQDLFKHIAGWKSSTRRENNQGTKWQGWGTKNERGFYLDKEWDVLKGPRCLNMRQGPSVMQILPNQQSRTFVSNGSKVKIFID